MITTSFLPIQNCGDYIYTSCILNRKDYFNYSTAYNDRIMTSPWQKFYGTSLIHASNVDHFAESSEIPRNTTNEASFIQPWNFNKVDVKWRNHYSARFWYAYGFSKHCFTTRKVTLKYIVLFCWGLIVGLSRSPCSYLHKTGIRFHRTCITRPSNCTRNCSSIFVSSIAQLNSQQCNIPGASTKSFSKTQAAVQNYGIGDFATLHC